MMRVVSFMAQASQIRSNIFAYDSGANQPGFVRDCFGKGDCLG